jgi:glycyl-tRNA synthetase
VTNLVEEPTPILGSFDPSYLELPAEVLTTVMRKHQRYLPVRDADNRLLPHFVAVANGSVDAGVVRAGNEAVLRARYEDAAFFWRADLHTPLDTMKDGLAKLTFAEGLGSIADRAERVAGLAEVLAERIDLSRAERSALSRAGELAKFDLASHMVIELSSLAGVMAREYARRAGEDEAVAAALFEMELPRQAGDALPVGAPGALLSLADRFDLLVGLFGVGASPTGSSDPFGLRRAALGLVSVLRAFPALRPVTVSQGLRAAVDRLAKQGVEVPAGAVDEAREFVRRRYEQQLLDAGHDHRFVGAVLPLADAPAAADATLTELTELAGDPTFARLATALQRVRRIVPQGTAAGYEPGALTEPAEIGLHRALQGVLQGLSGRDVSLREFVSVAEALIDPVDAFFADVLVMAEEPEARDTRLGLLATITDLAGAVLDWAALGTSR